VPRERSRNQTLIVALMLVAAVMALVSAAAARANLSASAAEAGVVQRASSGALAATYSFSGNYPNYGTETVTIRDAGRLVYSAPVRAPDCGTHCAPGSPGHNGHSLRFAVLAAGAKPSLVLNLYSGGAHCCTIAQVFAPSRGPRWTVTSHSFGDPGYRLTDLNHDGAFEFMTADDRFAYAFTDYAGSGLPLQILTFTNGRFTDITRSHPALIARDASTWMRAFQDQRRSHYADTTGVVAAWAADEDNLGHEATVARFLNQQAHAGHLNSELKPQVPVGQRFVTALGRFLEKLGYTRR
jgi:hypothetical protein